MISTGRTGDFQFTGFALSAHRNIHLGEGYLPNYTRTDITDALHEAFGFRTDYNIIPSKQMKQLVKASKKRIRHA